MTPPVRLPARQKPKPATTPATKAPVPTPAQKTGNQNARTILHAQGVQAKPLVGTSTDKLPGAELGTNGSHDKVTVKRQVGSAHGYEDRWQASAVARIAKADPAAVVVGTNGRFYPVETSALLSVGAVSHDQSAAEHVDSNSTLVADVFGLPPLSSIKPDGSVESRAAAIFGVPEKDIQANGTLSQRSPHVINIIGRPESGSPGGGHAPVGGGDPVFQEGVDSTIWIDFPELTKERSAETLFHETQHLRDWDLAQRWIATYKAETNRLFVKSATKPFATWLREQVKKNRLSKADAELVLMEVADSTAYTEARANVRSFLADLEAGNSALAKKALVGYAHALKPKSDGGGGQYANPATGSEVEAELVKEAMTARSQLSETQKKDYDDAVVAAVSENPNAWISALDFSKKAKK